MSEIEKKLVLFGNLKKSKAERFRFEFTWAYFMTRFEVQRYKMPVYIDFVNRTKRNANHMNCIGQKIGQIYLIYCHYQRINTRAVIIFGAEFQACYFGEQSCRLRQKKTKGLSFYLLTLLVLPTQDLRKEHWYEKRLALSC